MSKIFQSTLYNLYKKLHFNNNTSKTYNIKKLYFTNQYKKPTNLNF